MIIASILMSLLIFGLGQGLWKAAEFAADKVPLRTKSEIRGLSDVKLERLIEELRKIDDGLLANTTEDARAIWNFALEELEGRRKPATQVEKENRLNRNRALEAVRAAARD